VNSEGASHTGRPLRRSSYAPAAAFPVEHLAAAGRGRVLLELALRQDDPGVRLLLLLLLGVGEEGGVGR